MSLGEYPLQPSRKEGRRYTDALEGNVLSAKAPNEKIPFIADSDLEVYKKYRDAAFEVQVGLHELTGRR